MRLKIEEEGNQDGAQNKVETDPAAKFFSADDSNSFLA